MQNSKLDQELSYATHKKHTIKFKVVFVGDQAVGKSSIINRFIKNQFDATHNPTVGIDFVSKNLTINDKAVRLQLWDTAGQQRFKSLIPGYLRDSHAIFLIYDVTNKQSYENLAGWIDYVKEHRGQDVVIFVIGNKIDLQQERVVSSEQVKERLKLPKDFFIEVSAKTGHNLDKLFKQACQALLEANAFETSAFQSQTIPQKNKKQENFLKQKEKPIKKQPQAGSQKVDLRNNPSMRGSKLMKKDSKGKVVREKNCC